MKFLADENISSEVVQVLRNLSHDVKSITEISPGIDDISVINLASKEKRILITCDTDFGELVFHQFLKHSGLILLRLDDQTNPNQIKVLKLVLSKYKSTLKNNFVTVQDTKIRIRSPLQDN